MESFTIITLLSIFATSFVNAQCPGEKTYTLPDCGCGGGGWWGVERATYRWCVKSFLAEVDQAVAEANCESIGAKLTGFESAQDLQNINYNAIMTLSPAAIPSGSFWVGAKRTAACMGQGLTATCTTKKSFYWTDGSTNTNTGFLWDNSQNQPDNAKGRTQNCAIYLAHPLPNTLVFQNKWWWVSQTMDDVTCDIGPNPEGGRKIVGYICGKKAV